MNIKLFLLNICFFVFLFTQGVAAQFKDTLSVDQVVVTATRTPRQLKDTPILTKVISSLDIAKYGKTRLEDILTNELAGIEFHQAGYCMTLSYQGLDARNVLVLVNGVRISGEINGNIDFSRINPISIERIEVMKGSASVLYGSSSMGATINIITKELEEKSKGAVQIKYSPLFENNSASEGENANQPNLDASAYYATSWGKLKSVTDLKAQSSDPYRLVSTEEEKRKYTYVDKESTNIALNDGDILYVPIDKDGISVSGWNILTLNQKFSYQLSPSFDFVVNGGYYAKERFDLNDYDVTDSDDETYNSYSGLTLDAIMTYEINDAQKLDVSVNYSGTKLEEVASVSSTPKQNHKLTSVALNYMLNHGKSRFTAGANLDNETLQYDLTEGGYTDKRDYSIVSLYAQDEFRLADMFDLTLGLRATLTGVGEGEAGDFSLTPRAAVTYLLGQTTLRANWARGYRTPTLKERYIKYYQSYMGSWIVGNEDLVAETNNYYSLSGEYFSKNKKFTASVMAYMNFFKNKIDTYFDDTINSYVYNNTQSTLIQGVELSAKIMLVNNLWLGGAYSFNDNQEDAPTNSAQYIFTSPHTATLNASYRYFYKKWRFDLNTSARYVGAKDYEDRMPTIISYDGSLEKGIVYGIYEGHTDAYTIVDASLSAELNRKVKFMVGLDNILNYIPAVASFNSAVTSGTTISYSVQINF